MFDGLFVWLYVCQGHRSDTLSRRLCDGLCLMVCLSGCMYVRVIGLTLGSVALSQRLCDGLCLMVCLSDCMYVRVNRNGS